MWACVKIKISNDMGMEPGRSALCVILRPDSALCCSAHGSVHGSVARIVALPRRKTMSHEENL